MENNVITELAGINGLHGLDLSQYRDIDTYIEQPDDLKKRLYDERRVLNHAHFYEWDEWEEETIDEKLDYLHRLIVQEIIDFCERNDVKADFVTFDADCLMDSIKVGKWHPGTDSSLVFRDSAGNVIIESL